MNLSHHAEEWAKEIGVAAALLKYNGLNDDYVKAYVNKEIPVPGESTQQLLTVARQAYATATAKLSKAKPGRLACNSPQGGFAFFEPRNIDKVAAAQWLKNHLTAAPAKAPYCTAAFYAA